MQILQKNKSIIDTIIYSKINACIFFSIFPLNKTKIIIIPHIVRYSKVFISKYISTGIPTNKYKLQRYFLFVSLNSNPNTPKVIKRYLIVSVTIHNIHSSNPINNTSHFFHSILCTFDSPRPVILLKSVSFFFHINFFF